MHIYYTAFKDTKSSLNIGKLQVATPIPISITGWEKLWLRAIELIILLSVFLICFLNLIFCCWYFNKKGFVSVAHIGNISKLSDISPSLSLFQYIGIKKSRHFRYIPIYQNMSACCWKMQKSVFVHSLYHAFLVDLTCWKPHLNYVEARASIRPIYLWIRRLKQGPTCLLFLLFLFYDQYIYVMVFQWKHISCIKSWSKITPNRFSMLTSRAPFQWTTLIKFPVI